MVFLLQAARDVLLLHASFNAARSSRSRTSRRKNTSFICILTIRLRFYLKILFEELAVILTAPNYVVLMEQKIIQNKKKKVL